MCARKKKIQSALPELSLTMAEPHLVLDLYVLSQGVKTGVYRVCDEVFPRLIAKAGVPVGYLVRPGFEEGAARYLKEKSLPENIPVFTPSSKNVPKGSLLLSPFGVAPAEWLGMPEIKHAHIIYDLIAIQNPDFFTPEGSTEVRSIIESLGDNTVIFAISKHTKADLLGHRSDLFSEQVTVIPLAAADKFSICSSQGQRETNRKKYAIPSKVPYLLSLATLEIRKNMEQVIRSYVRFMDQHPDSDLHLVLSGMAGWKNERIEAALSAAGLWRHRIITTGYVDDQDLPPLYSDALCFLYLSRAEGFGLPPLEAMACGTPVITSDNSSLPEVVGDAGWMFDAEDTDGVARCIAQLLASPEKRVEYSQRGIDRAKTFSWDRCAAIMLDKLQNALSREPAESKEYGPSAHGKASHFASFYGYENGACGPSFSVNSERIAVLDRPTGWPEWRDAITCYPPLIAGGKRAQGIVKSSSPGRPLISYVTVVKNNESGLERAIQSVQAQTYTNVEHIVVDGASTDGTVKLIKRFADRIDYFISEPDKGLYDALNKAVPLARGELICILNSDDWLHPEAAATVVRRMSNRTRENAILLTGANVVSAEGASVSLWSPAFLHPGSYFLCPNICHNGVYATRKAYECSGRYDASYKIAADSKWILQCLKSGVHVTYSAEPTVNYSLGGISGDADKHRVECIRIIQESFPFLAYFEAETLYNAFNVFAKEKAKTLDVSWSNCIRKIFTKYSNRPDFLLALSWAGVLNMEHHYDLEKKSDLLSGTKAKIRRFGTNPRLLAFFMRRPRLFTFARAFSRKFLNAQR